MHIVVATTRQSGLLEFLATHRNLVLALLFLQVFLLLGMQQVLHSLLQLLPLFCSRPHFLPEILSGEHIRVQCELSSKIQPPTCGCQQQPMGCTPGKSWLVQGKATDLQ